jgi:hypothetical protein
MLRGVFNSIILVSGVSRRIALHANRHYVRIQFNHAANQNAPAIVRFDTLRGRFNNCNDNLGFSGEGEQKDDAKAALIRALIDMLKEISRRVAEGTATLSEALGLIGQLESLGIRVSGLPLYAPGAPLDSTKTAYTRHVHQHRMGFAA